MSYGFTATEIYAFLLFWLAELVVAGFVYEYATGKLPKGQAVKTYAKELAGAVADIWC